MNQSSTAPAPALRVGFGVTGSFCTFRQVMEQLQACAAQDGWDIQPLMSAISYETDTRFGRAEDFIRQMEALTGKPVWHTVAQAEPIGPKKLLDVMVVAPCTGNTLGKLANGITDTSITMAVKAHLRNARPVVLAVSTNDALSGSARNIGQLLGTRNLYFVPMRQDSFSGKPTSIVADFTQLIPTIQAALEGRQLQPLTLPPL